MTKKLLLGVFVSVFLLALVSSLSISNVDLGNVNPGQTVTVNVPITNTLNTNTYTVNFTSSDITLPQTVVANNSVVTIVSNYVVTSTLGSKTFTVNYDYTNASTSSGSFNVTMNVVTPVAEKLFCPNGQIGKNLTIDNVDISNSGDKDNKWKFLDTITVEVRVKNTGDDDVDNVIVELGLFDSNGDDFSGDLDFINDEEEQIDVGDLNDGDKETAVFEFRVPADFDAGNYKLAVKAYSDDVSEDILCADKSNDLSNDIYESIKVEEEDDEGKFIGFDNVELSSDQFTCGDTGTLAIEAFNVGQDDQDRVKITLYNEALKINQIYEIKNNFDVGDSAELSFNFAIPSNVKDGNYNLKVTADYDYKNGNYRENLDEDFLIPIKLLGCSTVPTSSNDVSISASADNAKAGSEFTVEAVIRNLADEDKSFLIEADDYSSWAELVSISDRTLTLGAGESEVVTITLKANKDASSEESLKINAISDGKTQSKEVSVPVEAASSFSLKGSPLIWVIAGVNLVLIILIILVAVKLSRN